MTQLSRCGAQNIHGVQALCYKASGFFRRKERKERKKREERKDKKGWSEGREQRGRKKRGLKGSKKERKCLVRVWFWKPSVEF